MPLHYTQLTKLVMSIPPGYGMYALKHIPTGHIYFGSSKELPKRLLNWYYAFGNPQTPLPTKVENLVLASGRDPLNWAYSIIDRNMPAGYRPRDILQNKPEWACVQWLKSVEPAYVLNDLNGKGGRPSGGAAAWGPQGISPLKYLNVKLGVHRGRRWEVQPPCNRPIDTRSLTPTGAMDLVPFAHVLRLAMNVPPRHLNPSPAAIDELYHKWAAAQPAGFTVGLPGTITTADAALALPDPAEWIKKQPATLRGNL